MPKSYRIEEINALAELQRVGWDYEPASDHEVRCKCPVHADNTPSVSLNTDKNLWICHAATCDAKGDIVSLLAYIAGAERREVLAELKDRYDIETVASLDPRIVEQYASKIQDAGPLLKALHDRGLTDDMIRRAKLGFHQGRIMIPVFDEQRRVLNIRKYLPGAPGPEKMRNTKGYSQPRLYGIETLEHDRVWILGGELKALLVGEMLFEDKVGACAVTAGEGAWDANWNRLFRDKKVFICMDVDLGGIKAARKIASILHNIAEVYIIDLPLDLEKHPKGDVNDFVGQEGGTRGDLLSLMDAADRFRLEKQDIQELERRDVSLNQAIQPHNIAQPLRFKGLLVALERTPYLVPKKVAVSCTRDQPNCGVCPIAAISPDDPATGIVEVQIQPHVDGILDLISAPKNRLQDAIRDSLGIPKCSAVEFKTRSHYSVRDVRVGPQLSLHDDSSDSVVYPGFVLEDGIDLNVPYSFEGICYPHPKDQSAVLLISAASEDSTSLTTFEPTTEQMEELQVFQPEEWTRESIHARLDEIYRDLEANVTGIYHRRGLHLAVDLTYHSVLLAKYDGREFNCWVNALVLGDSSQGKTETTQRLRDHYGLGERIDCKNASAAGLIGGLQQMGNRWFISWGAIPLHDQRLVILEELKGIPVEVIGRMTDMRSSGIAEIPKIEHRKARARTRLLAISNPRSTRQVTGYSFGVLAIEELIGGLEDVRRFDLAYLVSSAQVSANEINKLAGSRPSVEHKYSSELCRRLVLWAWTRKPSDIVFEDESAPSECASHLCSKYSETIPLVDRGTARFKIARLAIALATRTYSVDRLGRVVVRRAHVEYVASFLDNLYSDPIFGYAEYSAAKSRASKITDEGAVIRHIRAMKYPADFVEACSGAETIVPSDIMDWCEVDKDEAQRLLSLLVRKRCLRRDGRVYRKTQGFITLMKSLELHNFKDQEPEDGDEL